ncbi:MarR family transcriptional regulator [archaeon]|nr:MarR family transcriptional regulator [archaeon]
MSLIKSSAYRYKILKSIEERIKTPAEISRDIEIRLNHVSMFLKDLRENEMVVCLNADSKKGRLYQITDFGKNVLKRVDKGGGDAK